jgi:hypothetical protein
VDWLTGPEGSAWAHRYNEFVLFNQVHAPSYPRN